MFLETRLASWAVIVRGPPEDAHEAIDAFRDTDGLMGCYFWASQITAHEAIRVFGVHFYEQKCDFRGMCTIYNLFLPCFSAENPNLKG